MFLMFLFANTLCIEGKPKGDPVFEDHPQVLQAMQEAEDLLRKTPREPNTDICIKALQEGIAEAEQRYTDSGNVRRYT